MQILRTYRSRFRKWRESKSKKSPKEDLYTRILLWAYSKQETGFFLREIKSEFELNSIQDTWMRNIFLTTSDSDRKIFEHLRYDESVTPPDHRYCVNEKGIATAINYLNTKATEKISKQALFVSALALIILAWQFLMPIDFQIGQCYVGASSGDKVIRMNCPNWIRIGEMLNLSWDSSYDVK